MRALVDNVPIGLLVVLVVGLILGIVMLGVWLVRRLLPATREGFDAEVASQMLGVVAAFFGLLLAFVIVIEYQNYGDAQGSVSEEADALAAIVRDSDALAEPGADRLRVAVSQYIGAVVVDEWPRMRDGEDSDRAWAAVSRVYGALQAVDPQPGREEAFYQDAVRQLTEALRARRDRLEAASGGLPPLVAAMLIVGSLVILGYAVLVGSRSASFHAIGAGSLAVIIGLSFVVLLDLSYPFAGTFAIDYDPLRTGVLEQFDIPPR